MYEEVRLAGAAAILLLLRDMCENKSQPSKYSRAETGRIYIINDITEPLN